MGTAEAAILRLSSGQSNQTSIATCQPVEMSAASASIVSLANSPSLLANNHGLHQQGSETINLVT
jgi:hypothetical protein